MLRKGGKFMNFQENDSLKDVLEKYGRDITKNVEDKKIDPVIGRCNSYFIAEDKK